MNNPNKHYGCLDTKWKLQYYPERIQSLLTGRTGEIAPVTVHFAPTLRCNHQCYFCTYGKTKKKNNSVADMTLKNAEQYIRQLKEAGVESIIFTGGGDPCMHKDLIEMMKVCNEVGLAFSVNTNGLALTKDMSEKILRMNPVYVRVSINAGSPKIQKIMSGIDDYEIILANFKELMINSILLKSKTQLSIAYVVGVTNYFDIENLFNRLVKIDESIYSELKSHVPINMTIRPIYNYEFSKNENNEIYDETIAYLQERSQKEADEYANFMNNGAQTPQEYLNKAVTTIQNKLWVKTKQGDFEGQPVSHKIKVYFPAIKFKSINAVFEKPYAKCSGLYFYAFIWPDGRIFPCVEYAGTNGFEIGNLNCNNAKDIFTSEKRKNITKWINNNVIHSRCATVCAYHEANCYLDGIIKGEISCPCNKYNDIPLEARFI